MRQHIRLTLWASTVLVGALTFALTAPWHAPLALWGFLLAAAGVALIKTTLTEHPTT